MTLEEALAEIEKQKAELTKVAERLSNAESLIGRQGTELGDLRKLKTENEGKVKDLETENAELKKKISEAGGTPPGNKQEEDDPDKLEANLNESQVKVLDEAWKRAPAETRQRIVADPKARLAFIREAMTVAPTAPDTWRKATRKDDAASKPNVEDDIKALFGRHRPTRTVPAAGRPGTVLEATGREEEGAANRPVLNPSDVSGSLRRLREQRSSKE